MLQNIRDRSSGIIAKFIVGLIAVTFVVTGVNFFVVGDEDPVVAEVGSVEIREGRFLERLEQERRQLLQVLNDPALIDEARLRQSVLAALIEEAAAVDYANALGFGAPENLIDQVILEIPQFQRDGQFDPVLYDQAISQIGLSRLGFRADLQRNLLDYQVRGAIDASVVVLPGEAAQIARLQGQRRSGELVVISTDRMSTIEVSVSDADIEASYAANTARYQRPEAVVIDYVTLSVDDFRDDITITESDVRAAYDAEVAQAATETERRARHILVSESADALEQVQTLRDRILAGEDFASIAREASDDIASRELGGDLGFAPAGTFVPEFEAAMASLPVNTLSEPVKTQYGYHLIEVLETRAREVDPFERRAIAIREELEDQAAAQQLAESLEEFSNIAFSGSLEELRTVYGVEINTTTPISSTGGEGLFSSPGVIRRAFDPTLREAKLNAEVFEVEPGVWMTFRVAEYQAAEPKPLDEVREEIESTLRAEAQLTEAKRVAESIEAFWLSGGVGLPDAAPAELVKLVRFEKLPRAGDDQVDANVLRVAFNAPAPGAQPSTQLEAIAGQPMIVARVDTVELADPDAPVVAELRSAITDLRMQQEAGEFWSTVNQNAKVSRP